MTEHHFSTLAENLLTWLAASDEHTSAGEFVQAMEEWWELTKAEWAEAQKNLKPGDPYYGLPDPQIAFGPYFNGTEDWVAVRAELEHAGMITAAADSSNLTITDAGRAWVRRRDDT